MHQSSGSGPLARDAGREDLGDKCTNSACIPSYHKQHSTIQLLFSSLPFIITFSAVSIVVLHRLFPALCGAGSRHHSPEGRLWKRIAALTFSTTLGATGVLAELILCEVSDWVDSDARRLAFRVVVTMLLVCLIVVIPLLEMRSALEGCSTTSSWERRTQLAGLGSAFLAWLWIFWVCGDWLPVRSTEARSLSEECLARVGVVGVSLMALLWFGCVSTPWQSFGGKPKPVSDTEISRAQGGLDATNDLLAAKRNQLYIVERRLRENPSTESMMSKMISSVYGNADSREIRTLHDEITGLQTMLASLTLELHSLQRRQSSEQASRTAIGRFISTIYYGFSIYCVYRIAATTLTHLPRIRSLPSSSFSQSDPINNVLALLAKHWDPDLDRAAWSRQISFLLSGVIITGSLSSVMTTLNMLTRAAPGVLLMAVKSDSPNLALFVSQLSAVYVLASALLLRSNLPPQMSTVISESLGAPLDPAFVDRWFDALFLGAAALTAVAMYVSRRLGRSSPDDGFDGMDDIEVGKRS